jgi:hypothetical protein
MDRRDGGNLSQVTLTIGFLQRVEDVRHRLRLYDSTRDRRGMEGSRSAVLK